MGAAGSAYDAIVVGGGHNGLICAAYLARGGRRVLVLERRPRVGGASVTEEVWPGYRVSVLSYVVSLLQPDIVSTLELARHGYHVYPLDPASFHPYPDGRGFLHWGDPHRCAAAIAAFSRRDAAAYLRYDAELTELVGVIRPLLGQVPPDLAQPTPRSWPALLGVAGRALRHRRRLARLADLLTLSVADFLDAQFESEPIKAAIGYGGVIGAWAGPRSPGTAYVLLHHRMGQSASARGGWGFVRGGMGALADAIAGAARAAGADIRTEAEVAAIDIAGGAVRGVTLGDGTVVPAPVVAASCHPRIALLELVGDGLLPAALVDELRRYRSRSPVVKVNCAIDGLPDFTAAPGTDPGPQHPEFVICPSLDYLERSWDDAKHGRLTTAPLIDGVIPSTKDPTLAPAGRHVLSCFVQYLPPSAPASSAGLDRDAVADRVTATIAAYAPGFADRVLHRQVVTQADMEREYGLVGGNIFHGELALDQLYAWRPASQAAGYRTPIRGLYLCGSGSHPGGGVMGAPGRNAARVILGDRRRVG